MVGENDGEGRDIEQGTKLHVQRIDEKCRAEHTHIILIPKSASREAFEVTFPTGKHLGLLDVVSYPTDAFVRSGIKLSLKLGRKVTVSYSLTKEIDI